MAESQTIDVSASRGKIARQWLEVAIQTGFCFGMMILISGVVYPLYAFWPFPFNGFWQNRNLFLIELLPYAFAFLSLYLSACWQWLQLHNQPVSFRRFGVVRQLIISLTGMILIALPLQLCRLLGLPGFWPYLIYVFSFLLVCRYFWPWLENLQIQPGRKPLRLILLLSILQALAFWMMSFWPLLASLFLLLSALLLPGLASAWKRQLPDIKHEPWQLLFVLVLTGFVVMGLTAWWSWNQLLPLAEHTNGRIQALQRSLKLERSVLRGRPIAGNAYQVYAPIIGHHMGTRKALMMISTEDSDKIRAMFDLSTGRLQPNIEMLNKYKPVIEQLKHAGQYSSMQYPHSQELLLMPEVGLFQDLALLRLADAMSHCRQDNCLEGAQGVLSNLQMLQDLATHGFATAMMVAYKMERINLSALGLKLSTTSLTPAQWLILLNEWQRLMSVEKAHFDKVIAMEMLIAERTLMEILPQLEADVDAQSGSLPEWLGILPYIRLGLPELELFGKDIQAYLKKPIHDPLLWKRVIDQQLKLVESNPFVRSVLIDSPALIYRFREHQIMMRGFYQHLALNAYYAEHGRYPKTLTALVPKWLPALPQDPYTGQPFAYHSVDKSYTLYSLGLNQQDDGNGSYYGHFKHAESCRGDEIVFAPDLPVTCRGN